MIRQKFNSRSMHAFAYQLQVCYVFTQHAVYPVLPYNKIYRNTIASLLKFKKKHGDCGLAAACVDYTTTRCLATTIAPRLQTRHQARLHQRQQNLARHRQPASQIAQTTCCCWFISLPACALLGLPSWESTHDEGVVYR